MTKFLGCGVAVADIIAADVERISKPGESGIASRPIAITIGGHACNVPIDLVQLGLSPNQVSTIISVGRDFFGEFILNTLKFHGIKVRVFEADDPTSTNLIIVVKGEDRRFHNYIGANLQLDPQIVIDALEREKPILFYIGAAGGLGRFDDNIEKVCKKAKELGCIVLIDAVVPYKKNWDYIIPSLSYADIFHCNDVEALSLTEEGNLIKALNKIRDYGVKMAIVTSGEKGSVTCVNNMILEAPIMKVSTIDPTGAGDAFCSGIILKLLEIQKKYKKKLEISELNIDDIKGILTYASATGAACVTKVGTTTAVKAQIVNKILSLQKNSFAESIKVRSE